MISLDDVLEHALSASNSPTETAESQAEELRLLGEASAEDIGLDANDLQPAAVGLKEINKMSDKEINELPVEVIDDLTERLQAWTLTEIEVAKELLETFERRMDLQKAERLALKMGVWNAERERERKVRALLEQPVNKKTEDWTEHLDVPSWVLDELRPGKPVDWARHLDDERGSNFPHPSEVAAKVAAQERARRIAEREAMREFDHVHKLGMVIERCLCKRAREEERKEADAASSSASTAAKSKDGEGVEDRPRTKRSKGREEDHPLHRSKGREEDHPLHTYG